jgi:SAM-dependent methyltransferase
MNEGQPQRKYDLIFIAIGSFQLIHDNKEALHVLENLHSALLPEGRLVIETSVPWDAIKDNIHSSILAKQSNEIAFEKAVNAATGSRIVHKSVVMMIDEVVSFLISTLNIQSILLYGSYAQNLQDEHSDYDLLVLMKEIPLPSDRKSAYEKIPHAKVIEIASTAIQQDKGWDNSWSPINDKLLVQGKRVEIGYNTTRWANRIVNNLIVKNKTTCKDFPFRPYTFLGLLEACRVLYDRDHFIQKIRSQIRPIPEPLKKAIFKEFYPILLEAHEELKDYARRSIGILAYQFHLFRGIDALMQILFVLNDVYDPALKRIEPFLFNLKQLPPHFKEFVIHTLPRFYEKQKEVNQFLKNAIHFLRGHERKWNR